MGLGCAVCQRRCSSVAMECRAFKVYMAVITTFISRTATVSP